MTQANATEQAFEKAIQAKGLNAPRLTPANIDSVIKNTQYFRVEESTATICAITLTNGTVVTGMSACVSPENFDPEIGEQVAFDDARRKIWDLEGYLLKQRLWVETVA
jgi:hypothetical protein